MTDTMTTVLQPYETYVSENFPRFINELKEWLRIPSISASPAHAPDVARAAAWAAHQLAAIGFPSVDILENDTHPLVYAEYIVNPSLPTVLFYGHFDVQPPEPLNEWISAPFSPEEREGNLYARGAADDKGQVMIVFKALETLIKVDEKLPVNVKILLEGEEETTGEAIDAFVRANPEKLAATCVLICDTHMLDEKNPVLITGLRGMLYTELTVHGAKNDLHSGLYGGIAPNPLHALCHVIAALKDAQGHINIAGFEELLPSPSAEEVDFWRQDPLGLAEKYQQEMGVTTLVGPANIPPAQRVMAWPTVEVHGIRGGFVGEGAKTVIPATATAKISLRLPGGVKPKDVWPLLQNTVKISMPDGYEHQLNILAEGEGVVVKSDSSAVQSAAQALKEVYGTPARFIRSGGSIPIATLFHQVLQLPIILMGFGLPDDRLHAPNEKLSIQQFRKGVLSVIGFMHKLNTA